MKPPKPASKPAHHAAHTPAATHVVAQDAVHPSGDDPTSALFREPYERLRPEFDALAEDDLIVMNLDIPLAVTTALGALPALRALRPQIVAELPRFDHARFDRLEAYTRAAAHAHALYVAASTPAASLTELAQQATALRDSLLVAAGALADRGIFPRERLAEARSGQGYREVYADLLALAAMFRGAWSTINHRTAVEPADLDRAESLANDMMVALSKRDQTDPAVVAAAAARRRAATVFVNVYDQARRAATYLRWDAGDADTLVPSVYVRSAPAKKREAAAGAGSSTSATGATASAPAHAAPAVPTAPPAGVPQSDPFAH